jgi:peroxiredoxin
MARKKTLARARRRSLYVGRYNCGKSQDFKTTKFMAIKVGSQAPDFTLKSKNATGLVDVKLSENFGKRNSVLLFFPAAFTSVCTKEMCDITSGLGQYSSLNAAVIGLSVDTPFAQEAWAKQEKIGITLVSDLNKTTTQAYDVVFPNLAGIGDTSARAAFVIDKQGVVRYAEQTPTPKDLPDFNAIQKVLSGLK